MCLSMKKLTFEMPVVEGAVLEEIVPDLVNKRVVGIYGAEKFVPKDGDVVYNFPTSGWEFKRPLIFICKEFFVHDINNGVSAYAHLNGSGLLRFDKTLGTNDSENMRLATPEEAQLLFDALKKEGMRWNADKKCVEEIKPSFEIKKGDVFRCIKDVVMNTDVYTAYYKGRIYMSENDCCITNERKNKHHEWTDADIPSMSFVKLGTLNTNSYE